MPNERLRAAMRDRGFTCGMLAAKLGVDPKPGASNAEVIAFYPHRAQTPRSLWLDLLRGAEREIVLMAYASLFLPEENPDSTRILREKAAAGVKIRISLGDPDTPEVALRGRGAPV